MKKTFFTSILLLLICNSINAQANKTALISSANQTYSFDRSDKSVIGSPYIAEDYLPARVIGDEIMIYKIRYNAQKDQMEVEDNESNKYTIDKNVSNILIVFLANNKTYQSFDYLDEKDNVRRNFFVIISNKENPIKLLNKESKKYISRKAPKNGYSVPKPAHYKRADTYYIKTKDDNVILLPKKSKNIASLFPDNSSEILSFIKSNKIKTSKEPDLIELIDYINTL